MEIAVIENNQNRTINTSKHNFIQIFYIITSTICLIIEIYQRIKVDLFYSSYTNTNIHVPSFNRFPTEFTASYSTISYIWYLVYIFQILWTIYSFIGIFRRTSSGIYFYKYPCAVNEWAFFYTSIAHLFYIPQLISATDNTYHTLAPFFRYITTLFIVIFIFIIVNETLKENMGAYVRDKYIFDFWLTRIFYLNGLAIWATILFYECCLSFIIHLIYANFISISTASFVGISFFCFGLIILFHRETIKVDDTSPIILSKWLIFFWLLIDIQFFSNNKLSKTNYVTRFESIISYLVLFRIIVYFCSLYYNYKHKVLPFFHFGKVYSLIVPPTNF